MIILRFYLGKNLPIILECYQRKKETNYLNMLMKVEMNGTREIFS